MAEKAEPRGSAFFIFMSNIHFHLKKIKISFDFS